MQHSSEESGSTDASGVSTPLNAPRNGSMDTPEEQRQLSRAGMPPNLESAVAGGRLMANNPMDERIDLQESEVVDTPRAAQNRNAEVTASEHDEDEDEESAGQQESDGAVGRVLANAPHDEAIPVNDDDEQSEPHVATPMATRPTHGSSQQQRAAGGAMVPNDDEDTDEEEEEEEEDEESTDASQQYRPSYAGQAPAAIETEPDPQQQQMQMQQQSVINDKEYNPAKYAKANASANRDMQDLFKHIADYQPFVAELPAKLRPFIPDYIPAVGELDPFVKVPRPDGHPDGLGLYVIDEPSIPQSNPAVVQLELRATNAHVAGGAAQVVDSFEDAANRPEVIDRWITDVKKVHYKKPLATVNYQKPMPEIDTLLQAWPQGFEDMLNSDVQFPPPGIDMDLDQYVRTLCAILDIPTYVSLIDSLHVMFTLYEEFRGNQHFQHE